MQGALVDQCHTQSEPHVKEQEHFPNNVYSHRSESIRLESHVKNKNPNKSQKGIHIAVKVLIKSKEISYDI